MPNNDLFPGEYARDAVLASHAVSFSHVLDKFIEEEKRVCGETRLVLVDARRVAQQLRLLRSSLHLKEISDSL